jgi:hypothetical protein
MPPPQGGILVEQVPIENLAVFYKKYYSPTTPTSSLQGNSTIRRPWQ